MNFVFEIVKDGTVSDWRYDSRENVLQNEHGAVAHVTSEKEVGPCGSDPKRMHIRISLGVACNNQCAYCSQNTVKGRVVRRATAYDAFASALVAYVRKHFPDKTGKIDISFWGGEPLLYMDDIRALTMSLRDLLGDEASFSVCTNGKLLKGETFKWLYDNDFCIAVSHDGPGQFIRDGGEDIFANGSEVLECFKIGLARENAPYRLNPVFHKHNPSMRAYLAHMSNLLGTATFQIGEASYLRAYDDKGALYVLTEDQAREDAFDLIDMLFDAPEPPFAHLTRLGALQWLSSLNRKDRKRCFVQGQDNFLPVDLAGNVWGCHNNVGDTRTCFGDASYRGNIFTGEHVILGFPKYKRWVNETCADCVMRWLCLGGCLYVDPRFHAINCKVAWYHKLPSLSCALHIASNGGRLRRIIRQPGA